MSQFIGGVEYHEWCLKPPEVVLPVIAFESHCTWEGPAYISERILPYYL